MRARRVWVLALAVFALLALPSLGQARVPRGFVGMNVDEPLWPNTDPSVNMNQQFDRMVAAGVESVRVVFDWAQVQPFAPGSSVPAGFTDFNGTPTNFSQLDQIVGLAASHGIRVLPTVMYAPGWDAATHPGDFAIPSRYGPYGQFMTALIQRYGPKGSFWATQPIKVPISMWQVWNEPNINVFWWKQPFARSYVKLVHAAHDAIKAADPKAKVVLAGMPNYSWDRLKDIYRIRGARKLFDVVAVHPYTRQPQGVITILKDVRQVMNQHDDRSKPILADEISWPSSQGKAAGGPGAFLATTEKGQAKNLATLLPMLGRARRSLNLLGFDYFTWADDPTRPVIAFNFAGLLRFKQGTFTAKPALRAFSRAALSLEFCKKKGRLATACDEPG
jgi:hypothetical protein